MNKLIIPLVGAVVAGLCGGSAFSYVNAKEAAKVVALHVADSLTKVAKDSTAVADSVAKEEHARELAAAEELPLTPADSIRLAQNQPTTLSAATHDLPNAVDTKHAAPAAADDHGKPAPKAAAPEHAATPTKIVPAAKTASAPPKLIVPTAAEPAHAEAKAPAAAENALPERRISKMFGAMAAKDAAKILEQMSDNDIRVILGMMNDKQAAAILTALPTPRAAAISKGELSKTSAKDEKKPAGGHP